MGLRPTNGDESPVRAPRLFNELRWAFDRAAAFQAAFGRAGKRARGQNCPLHFMSIGGLAGRILEGDYAHALRKAE
jgi:hypothetical protein